MARVKIAKPEQVDDPAIEGIFEWVIEKEGAVPNHFYVEMNFPEFFPAKRRAVKDRQTSQKPSPYKSGPPAGVPYGFRPSTLRAHRAHLRAT